MGRSCFRTGLPRYPQPGQALEVSSIPHWSQDHPSFCRMSPRSAMMGHSFRHQQPSPRLDATGQRLQTERDLAQRNTEQVMGGRLVCVKTCSDIGGDHIRSIARRKPMSSSYWFSTCGRPWKNPAVELLAVFVDGVMVSFDQEVLCFS